MYILDTERFNESIKISPVTKKRLAAERPFDKDALVYKMTDKDKQILVDAFEYDSDDLEIIDAILDERKMVVFIRDDGKCITDSDSVERILALDGSANAHKDFVKSIGCAVRHHIWYIGTLCFDAVLTRGGRSARSDL